MGTILVLLGVLVFLASVVGLILGLVSRVSRRPIRFALRIPAALGLALLGMVVIAIGGAFMPASTEVAEVPQPKKEEAVTPAATPKPEPSPPTVDSKPVDKPQETQDSGQQPTEPAAPPQPEVKRISVGLFLVKCRNAVKDQLKSPNSAKFPSSLDLNAAAREMNDGSWALGSYVDAQNAFGVEVRNNFICTYNPVTEEIKTQITE